MFKNVIWATDGSEASDRALTHARTIAADAGGRGAHLIAVHCEEMTLPGKAGGSFPILANEDEVQTKISGQVAELSSDGVSARLELSRSRVGGAAQSIADVAAREHADVIVVGTRGRSPFAGLLLGSVTQRLLHIAPCPVLAVPAANGHKT